MESVSVAPARVSTLPSPTLKRKSPPSPTSVDSCKGKEADSPSDIVGALALAAQVNNASDADKDRDTPITRTPTPSVVPESTLQTPSDDDFEKGIVVCGTCGEGVPFRDPQTGGFTLGLWDQHREQCKSQNAPQPEPIVFTPETTVDSMANPPQKKRRAKRTEEERIEYLRTDPYVAQFEPYRVLCASCNKWIRLRPNSTYCSIPWDAHRKSCLSKKAHAKAAHAAEGRHTILYSDPAARKFDVERVMCAHCDRWIPIGPEGGEEALHAWFTHRDECRSRTPPTRLSFRQVLPAEARLSDPALASPGGTRLGDHSASPSGSASGSAHSHHPPVPRSLHSSLSASDPLAALSTSTLPPSTITGGGSPHTAATSLASSNENNGSNTHVPHPGTTSPSFKDLHPGNFAPVQESRRRNAEQREALLRADSLLKDVEPNRVFCALCEKWVQLRQDSSFCAYPWIQHRGKCLARHQRRQEKPQMTNGHSRHPYGSYVQRTKYGQAQPPPHLGGDVDADGEAEDQLESEDEHLGVDRFGDDRRAAGPVRHKAAASHSPPNGKYKANHNGVNGYGAYTVGSGVRNGVSGPGDDDLDADAEGDPDLDADGDLEMDDPQEEAHRRDHYHGHSHANHRGHTRVELPPSLADLDTPAGRLTFTSASVRYLFRTTYEKSDEMSVTTLVNYLNAAMPADKHEDFDVQEVTKAVSSLAKSGTLVLEGDLLRLP